MNLGNFTIKATELIQQAQQLAFNAQNPAIESEHILKAMLSQEDSPVEYLLKFEPRYSLYLLLQVSMLIFFIY